MPPTSEAPGSIVPPSLSRCRPALSSPPVPGLPMTRPICAPGCQTHPSPPRPLPVLTHFRPARLTPPLPLSDPAPFPGDGETAANDPVVGKLSEWTVVFTKKAGLPSWYSATPVRFEICTQMCGKRKDQRVLLKHVLFSCNEILKRSGGRGGGGVHTELLLLERPAAQTSASQAVLPEPARNAPLCVGEGEFSS